MVLHLPPLPLLAEALRNCLRWLESMLIPNFMCVYVDEASQVVVGAVITESKPAPGAASAAICPTKAASACVAECLSGVQFHRSLSVDSRQIGPF